MLNSSCQPSCNGGDEATRFEQLEKDLETYCLVLISARSHSPLEVRFEMDQQYTTGSPISKVGIRDVKPRILLAASRTTT